MTAAQASGKASTVRALVRGTQAALIVQVLVAVLALAATAYALLETRRLSDTKAQLTADIEGLNGQITDLADANSAASAGYRHWQRYLGQGDSAALAQARAAFETALGEAPGNPIFLDQLGQIQFAQGDAVAARTSAESALRAALEETEAPALSYQARLAAYQCASGQPDAARETLRDADDLAAIAANPELAALLQQTCGAGLAARGPSPLTEPAPEVGVPVQPAPAAVADAYAVRIIFIHVRNEADRADAERLRAALREQGYRVPGIELVAAPRGYGQSLRYYYSEQSGEAERIARLVASSTGQLGFDGPWANWTPPVRSLVGTYENLPRDRVELWMPERSASGR